MREVPIDGKQVRIRATPPALLYYRQEFGVDLVKDMLQMLPAGLEAPGVVEIQIDPRNFDASTILRMAWAMARADARARKTDIPSFEQWLCELASVDFSDKALAAGVLEEAVDGFFRGTRPVPGPPADCRGPGRPTGPGVV